MLSPGPSSGDSCLFLMQHIWWGPGDVPSTGTKEQGGGTGFLRWLAGSGVQRQAWLPADLTWEAAGALEHALGWGCVGGLVFFLGLALRLCDHGKVLSSSGLVFRCEVCLASPSLSTRGQACFAQVSVMSSVFCRVVGPPPCTLGPQRGFDIHIAALWTWLLI